MGLIGDSLKARRMKDPVDGTAQVVGGSLPPDSAKSANVDLNLVVQAEGVPATSIEHSCMAPTRKWPYPGATLPVTFDRTDPDRLKIRWDEIPEAGDVAKQQAEALASQLNQGGSGQAGGADVSGIVEALQEAMPGAQIDVQGQPQGSPAAGSGASDDHVAQLERLVKLRDSGALSEQEFEREKARILGK